MAGLIFTSNDDANGTAFEHDLISNQFRNGGDVQGLIYSLDYLQGMGIKVGNFTRLHENQNSLIHDRDCILLAVRSSTSLGQQTVIVL